jgi:hypothetical protein
MKTLFILLAVLSQTGCAVYTVTSTVALITTSKSLTDHTTSKLAKADCDAVRMVTKQSYYCEVNDPARTYNRNGY